MASVINGPCHFEVVEQTTVIDADVVSIQASRSGMQSFDAFLDHVATSVDDIRSSLIPPVEGSTRCSTKQGDTSWASGYA